MSAKSKMVILSEKGIRISQVQIEAHALHPAPDFTYTVITCFNFSYLSAVQNQSVTAPSLQQSESK